MKIAAMRNPNSGLAHWHPTPSLPNGRKKVCEDLKNPKSGLQRLTYLFAWAVIIGLTMLSLSNSPCSTSFAQAQQAAASAESTAHDFDFLLGNWEFTAESKVPGVPPTYHGRWKAERTAQGTLVEDDYEGLDNEGNRRYLGTTIRAFDEKEKRWTTAFVQPPAAKWQLGTAWREGSEIHEESLSEGKKSRAHFYDIGPDKFSWSADRSFDGGKTWVTDFVRVRAHRVPSEDISRH